MLETTKKIYEEMDELMNDVISKTFSLDTVSCMNNDDIELMKRSLDLYNSAKKLAIKQAEIIDEQNKKLDKILVLLEKKPV